MDSTQLAQQLLSDKLEVTPIQHPELIETSPPTEPVSSEKKNMEDMLLTQEHLKTIKKDLHTMIDVMSQNPSLFARAANYWGELPLWQKIIAGIVLIIPTLVIAFFTHGALFLAISVFTLFTYVGASLILDNHYSSVTNTSDNLKAGISGLADVLGIVIQSLETLHQELAASLEQFQLENEKLAGKVIDLDDQVQKLTIQTERFRTAVQSLEETKNQLEQSTTTLTSTVQEHTKLLEKTSAQLEQTQSDYEISQQQLRDKITELNQVKTEMGLELEKTRKISTALKATVDMLSDISLKDNEQRVKLLEKLDTFLADEKASFDKIADRICEAEVKLALVQEELVAANERYNKLLERQEKQADRQEEQLVRLGAIPGKSAGATKLGIYKPKENVQISVVPALGQTAGPH